MSTLKLTVVVPGGRRCPVTLNAGDPLQKAVNAAMTRHGLKGSFSLAHHGKRLPSDLSAGLSRLPNNAEVELVQATNQAAGGAVQLAVQVSGAGRHKLTCDANVTLMDVLDRLASEASDIPALAAWANARTHGQPRTVPVFRVLQKEVNGEAEAGSTTLASLGLSGRALVRLEFRGQDGNVGQSRSEVSGPSADIVSSTEPTAMDLSLDEQPPDASNTPHSDGGLTHEATQSSRHANHQQKDQSQLEHSSLLPATQADEAEPAPLDSALQRERTPVRATKDDSHQSDSRFTPAKRNAEQSTFDWDRQRQQQAKTSAKRDNATSASADVQAASVNVRRSFVPSKRYVPPSDGETIQDFSTFKFPDAGDQSQPTASAMDVADQTPERQPSQAAAAPEPLLPDDERAPIIFKLDSSGMPRFEEVADEVFDLTRTDAKIMSKHQQKLLEEKPLMTRALRQRRREEQMSKYPRSVIRVTLPDQLVLEAVFHPDEPARMIQETLSRFLVPHHPPIELFVAPPRRLLRLDQSLVSQDLVPAAIVRLGSSVTVEHLSAEARAQVKTVEQARPILNRHAESIGRRVVDRAPSETPTGASDSAASRAAMSDSERRRKQEMKAQMMMKHLLGKK